MALGRGVKFLAFVVESYGALGNQAEEVLRLLNSTLNHSPARPFELSERAVIEALSVALQRGNALISNNGCVAARARAANGRVGRDSQSDSVVGRDALLDSMLGERQVGSWRDEGGSK